MFGVPARGRLDRSEDVSLEIAIEGEQEKRSKLRCSGLVNSKLCLHVEKIRDQKKRIK